MVEATALERGLNEFERAMVAGGLSFKQGFKKAI